MVFSEMQYFEMQYLVQSMTIGKLFVFNEKENNIWCMPITYLELY